MVGRYKNNSRGKDLYNKNSFAGFNSFSYSPQEAENNLTSTAIREDVSNSCSNQNTNESPRVQADMIQTPIRLSDINNGGIQDKKEVDSKMEYQQSSFIEESPDRNPDFIGLKFIGIIFDTYIIFSKNDDMIMLDQHAAHERIRFEMYMSKYKANDISVQMLIDPIIMDLDANDMDTVRKNIDVFSSFGFLVEEFGHRSISIRGLPNTFGEPESKRFIYELIDGLGKIDNIYDTKYDEIAEIACKSAIKGNDKISIEEAKHLIGQLEECSNPYTCPHGRPTMVKMTRYEIEKLFKRRM